MSKKPIILIANDDGIAAEGIRTLAEMAMELGEVYVCAPAGQCSAMSQKITITGQMDIRPYDFPVPVKAAYSIGGTPADCVRVGIECILPERPDYIFSGINYGYNAGLDIAYSGTVGAAYEGAMCGVTAIAFSAQHDGSHDVARAHLLPLTREIFAQPKLDGEIWNINFPGCPLEELKGIRRDCRIARANLYRNNFTRTDEENGEFTLTVSSTPLRIDGLPADSDVRAILDGYISVGRIKCAALN